MKPEQPDTTSGIDAALHRVSESAQKKLDADPILKAVFEARVASDRTPGSNPVQEAIKNMRAQQPPHSAPWCDLYRLLQIVQRIESEDAEIRKMDDELGRRRFRTLGEVSFGELFAAIFDRVDSGCRELEATHAEIHKLRTEKAALDERVEELEAVSFMADNEDGLMWKALGFETPPPHPLKLWVKREHDMRVGAEARNERYHEERKALCDVLRMPDCGAGLLDRARHLVEVNRAQLRELNDLRQRRSAAHRSDLRKKVHELEEALRDRDAEVESLKARLSSQTTARESRVLLCGSVATRRGSEVRCELDHDHGGDHRNDAVGTHGFAWPNDPGEAVPPRFSRFSKPVKQVCSVCSQTCSPPFRTEWRVSGDLYFCSALCASRSIA